jgi:hypothetical protein
MCLSNQTVMFMSLIAVALENHGHACTTWSTIAIDFIDIQRSDIPEDKQ